MELNTTYFYTVAITNWTHLLKPDDFKQIVLDSLVWLVAKKKIKVYGFVIMPNHINILWDNLAMNGKEMPYVSFMKFTAHRFLEELRKTDSPLLHKFQVKTTDRDYQFWQNDGLAKMVNSRKVLEQKLHYMHENPLQEHWNLATDPNDYHFSSCSFYEQNDEKFSWLTHYMDDY